MVCHIFFLPLITSDPLRDRIGDIKCLRLHCSASSTRKAKHCQHIDPADFCQGKTKRHLCRARVNVRLDAITGLYHFADISLSHNHPAPHDDHLPEYHPPTKRQKELVRDLVSIKSLGRAEINALLAAQFPSHPLSLRQVSNLLDQARRNVRQSVQTLGGDFVAIVGKLNQLKNMDDRWVVHIQVDEQTRRFQNLFWMSPAQVALAQRFYDVVINDIAMARNQYGLPLNVFIIVDQFFATRNIAYALHTSETAESHGWVLDCLFSTLPPSPKCVFFSDADLGLDAALSKRPRSEVAFHGRCLNHLDGNVVKKLAPILGPAFQSFREAFWSVYYSGSPEALEAAWLELVTKYPSAQAYLDEALWPDQERWAWTYVGTHFTCGVRTTGRVEGENRVNKGLGDSKTTAYELVTKLIERSNVQSDLEALRVRQVSLSRYTSSCG